MALSRYVLTSDVTIPAGTFTLDAAGEGTGSWAGAASAWAAGCPVTFHKDDVIEMDSAAGGGQALYNAIGAGNLRAWVDGDAAGHAGLSN
jgi:hypothetical protein